MNKGAWTASDVGLQIVPADKNRDELVMQHRSGDAVNLGFGEQAVEGEGLLLSESSPAMQVSGYQATLAVYGVCAAGESATGGYQKG